MNTINIIYEYDKIIDQLGDDIKKSNYKLQYFLDLLNLKRSFFYKKLKEKRFTSDEMKVLSKHLYPEEYKEYEVNLINQLLEKSEKEIKDGNYSDFETLLNETKKEYGL
jgi:predicted lipase